MADSSPGLGFQQTWSMAVGGMVGGGIFSTLGLVVSISGPWAWLSFVVAGLAALGAGYAYSVLARHYGEGGGAFTFLREIDAKGMAGGVSWILIVGYVLTNAVYAVTFGEYVAHVVGLGPWFPRAAAVAILALFIAVNLRSAGEAGGIEVFLVWFKLAVLVGLSTWGLLHWNPDVLSRGVPDAGPGMAVVGAASVFMAYEGFQLLAYDYGDIRDPDRTLPRAILTAIIVVIGVYVLVTLGTTMLVGADRIVEQREVALAIAGREAFGTTGLVVVTAAAAFSTGSAINATLFATARLVRLVAGHGELPAIVEHENAAGIPDRAVLALGLAAIAFCLSGSLMSLVEAASLTFLATFTVVCGLAAREGVGRRLFTVAGTAVCGAALMTLLVRLLQTNPAAVAVLATVVAATLFGRPLLLRHVRTEDRDA